MGTTVHQEEWARPPLRWRSTPPGVLQAVVMHAMHLQRAFRESFILCDIQGCSITEAAQMLGVTPEVVIRRLNRARGILDETIKRLCDGPVASDQARAV
jgi:DNA-directed RNA polymerase specialized sigma24 family protein